MRHSIHHTFLFTLLLMFLPWSFLTVNVILAVLQLLLVNAVGAILALYSRFGGDYANSIRWVRQGGYLEMYNTLVNSRDIIPKSTKLILVLTLLATLAASISDIGAVYFIKSSERQHESSYVVVKSSQNLPLSALKSFSGWSTSIRNGTSIVDAMMSMINNVGNSATPASGYVSLPRTSEYQVGCTNMAFQLWDVMNLSTPQSSCASMGFYPSGSPLISVDKATFTTKPNGRFSVSSPGQYVNDMYYEMALTASLSYGNWNCSMWDLSVNGLLTTSLNGVTSMPNTVSTKCVLPTDEILITSTTSIRYVVSDAQLFGNVTATVFHEQDDLVQAMVASVSNATFKSNSTMLVEIKTGNTTFDSISCYSYKNGTSPVSLACMYTTASFMVVEQQTIDPIIAAARGNTPWPIPPEASVAMTVSHLPTMKNQSAIHLPISDAKDACFKTSDYLASLGQNFFADWNAEELYVLYDNSIAEAGLEVPLWLMVCTMAAMLASGGLCLVAQYFLDARYTGSLYKVMSIQMADREDTSNYTPMVRWSKAYPAEFEKGFNAPGLESMCEVGSVKSETSLTRPNWR